MASLDSAFVRRLTAVSRKQLPVSQLADYCNPVADFAKWCDTHVHFISLGEGIDDILAFEGEFTLGGYKASIFVSACKYDKSLSAYTYAGYVLYPLEYARITTRINGVEYMLGDCPVRWRVCSRTEALFRYVSEHGERVTAEPPAEA